MYCESFLENNVLGVKGTHVTQFLWLQDYFVPKRVRSWRNTQFFFSGNVLVGLATHVGPFFFVDT
jgi:hypothetical protein